LPSAPAPLQGQAQATTKAPLQGGLGQIYANGYKIADTGINQRKTHGQRGVPAADSIENLYGNYKGAGGTARAIREAQDMAPGPDMITQDDLLRQNNPNVRQYVKDREFAIRHNGQPQSFSDRFDGIIPDRRSGGDPNYARAAEDFHISPNDPRYVHMLLGGLKSIPANLYINSTDGQGRVKGLGYDKLYDENGKPRPQAPLEPLPGEMPMTRDYPQPLPAMPQQALPEEMTARALPMDQIPNAPEGAMPMDDPWFQARRPEMDDSQPIASGGMGGQLPYDLDNPFQDVSNEAPRPRGLTREDDLSNGFGPQDPYQQYAMPQYQRPDPTGFYAGLDGVATQGLNNKSRMDMMRWQDWERDNQERGWDELNGGVINPLMSMFVKDPNTRARMQQSGQAQSNRYMQNRQLRNSERSQQFGEDKYYTDLRQDNDPNSYPNWLARQNATTNRINSATGVTNARSLYENRNSLIDNRGDEHERKQAWDQYRMRHGDSQDSWNAFNSLVRANQGQQRIDNQQSQFGVSSGQRQQELAIKQAVADSQIKSADARISEALRNGDIKQAQLELNRKELLLRANQRDKNGEYIYPDESAAEVGATRAVTPEPEKPVDPLAGLGKMVAKAFGVGGNESTQATTAAPKSKPDGLVIKKKDSKSGKAASVVYNPQDPQHRKWLDQVAAKFPRKEDVEAARREFQRLAMTK